MPVVKKGAEGFCVCARDWVLPESLFTHGVCGNPIKVTRIAKSRVYYVNERGVERFIAMKNIAFVCDSELEGQMALEISNKNREATHAKIEEMRKEAIKLIESIK